jgi:hypothetical protein
MAVRVYKDNDRVEESGGERRCGYCRRGAWRWDFWSRLLDTIHVLT